MSVKKCRKCKFFIFYTNPLHNQKSKKKKISRMYIDDYFVRYYIETKFGQFVNKISVILDFR